MIIATETAGGWENPTAGLHQAVCIDVIDLGTQSTQWGDKEKLKLMFQLEETKEDGTPMTIGRNYTRSLHEKAALRKDLKSWRGADLSDEERSGFDTEKLIGAQAQVNIEEFEKEDGSKGSGIGAILPPVKGQKLTVTDEYVRECERYVEEP